MKTKLFATILLFLLGNCVYGQLVRSKSSKSIDIQQGFNLNGFNTSGSFNYFLSNKIKTSAGFGFERKTYDFSNLNRFYLDVTAFYTVYQFSSKTFLDLKASFLFGVESSYNPVFGDYKQFYVGEGLGFRLEHMAFHFFSISFFAEQNFWQLSDPGSLSWKSGLILGYNF